MPWELEWRMWRSDRPRRRLQPHQVPGVSLRVVLAVRRQVQGALHHRHQVPVPVLSPQARE